MPNGPYGRVYGGDPTLVHIPDGKRKLMGRQLAHIADSLQRHAAKEAGNRSDGPLCPGCYMVALFNAAVFLAQSNGQSLAELGHTMSEAFDMLTHPNTIGASDGMEEIDVYLDPPDTTDEDHMGYRFGAPPPRLEV